MQSFDSETMNIFKFKLIIVFNYKQLHSLYTFKFFLVLRTKCLCLIKQLEKQDSLPASKELNIDSIIKLIILCTVRSYRETVHYLAFVFC